MPKVDKRSSTSPEVPNSPIENPRARPPASELPPDEFGHLPAPLPQLVLPISFEHAGLILTMSALALITFLNVLARYIFNISFAFTEEYSVALLFIVVLLGSSSALVKDQHVRMTFFIDLLPRQYQPMTSVLSLASVVVCLAVLVIYGGKMTYDAYRFGETSAGLGVPEWLYLIWLPLLSLLILFRCFGALWRLRVGTGGGA